MSLSAKETPSCYGANIEIQCLLHTHCNLRCKFCFETKSGGIRENNKINVDYIRKLPRDIFDTIFPTMQKFNIVYFNMNIMGGELFSDDIPDDIFDEYYNFASTMKEMIHNNYPDATIRFKCLSNGVYKNLDRVIQFLDSFESKIILSYDPIDRFSCDQQKQIWKETFDYFKNKEKYKLTLSIVLTKKTILKYFDDPLFTTLGNMIYTDTNIYVPRLDYQEYLPSDDDLFNFYKWCIDHELFNISMVHNLFIAAIHNINTSSCGRKSDFIFGEDFLKKYNSDFVDKCTEESPIPKDEYYGYYSDEIKDVCDCARYKRPIGLQKRGCFTCEHFKYCPKMCWTQILFQHYPIGECPFKRTIDLIQNNKDLGKRFDAWRKEYDSYHSTI